MEKGQGHPKVLNEEQKAWLCRWFPTIENKRLAKAMGISDYKLHEFAREMGLVKSAAGMKAIKRRQVAAALKTNLKNGCYDRKRGHAPSEATLEGARQRWRDVKAGKREGILEMIKRTDPERYDRLMQQRSESRKELIRKERRRVLYAMERKTKLISVVMKTYTPSQIHHRHNALRRGYLLDEDCREGQPGRYIIYYDRHTHRSAKFEENCIKDGFTFQKDE
jgi:hypothetical protein